MLHTPKVTTRLQQGAMAHEAQRPAMGILGLPEEAHLLIAERLDLCDR